MATKRYGEKSWTCEWNNGVPSQTSPPLIPPLKLKATHDNWSMVDSYFKEDPIPIVKLASSLDGKNTLLTSGIHNHVAEKYGTRGSTNLSGFADWIFPSRSASTRVTPS